MTEENEQRKQQLIVLLTNRFHPDDPFWTKADPKRRDEMIDWFANYLRPEFWARSSDDQAVELARIALSVLVPKEAPVDMIEVLKFMDEPYHWLGNCLPTTARLLTDPRLRDFGQALRQDIENYYPGTLPWDVARALRIIIIEHHDHRQWAQLREKLDHTLADTAEMHDALAHFETAIGRQNLRLLIKAPRFLMGEREEATVACREALTRMSPFYRKNQ
jgi:hypothetical protein